VQLSLFLDAFEEVGDSGHYRAQAGNVVLHEADAHLDRIPTSGAVVVLNMPLAAYYAFRSGLEASMSWMRLFILWRRAIGKLPASFCGRRRE
jgi:hypothetical protein